MAVARLPGPSSSADESAGVPGGLLTESDTWLCFNPPARGLVAGRHLRRGTPTIMIAATGSGR